MRKSFLPYFHIFSIICLLFLLKPRYSCDLILCNHTIFCIGNEFQNTKHDEGNKQSNSHGFHRTLHETSYNVAYEGNYSHSNGIWKLSVMDFKVHAKVKMRIAGTIALKPSGIQFNTAEQNGDKLCTNATFNFRLCPVSKGS